MHDSQDPPKLAGGPAKAGNPSRTAMPPAVQRFTDTLVAKTLLGLFPRYVRPNHLTVARFVLIPVVLVLLYYHYRWWSLGVFAVAICTDFIDGAMARTRDQITRLGTMLDPLADKLLVGAVLAWVGHHYLVVQIMLAFIALELIVSAVGTSVLIRTRQIRSANVFGKSKMVLQSLALLLFLLFGILDLKNWITVSVYMLWLALALALMSGGRHVYDMIRRRPPQ